MTDTRTELDEFLEDCFKHGHGEYVAPLVNNYRRRKEARKELENEALRQRVKDD